MLEMGMNAPGEIARMTEIADARRRRHHQRRSGASRRPRQHRRRRRGQGRAVRRHAGRRDHRGQHGRRVGRARRRAISAAAASSSATAGEVAASAIDDRGFDGIAFTLHVGAAARARSRCACPAATTCRTRSPPPPLRMRSASTSTRSPPGSAAAEPPKMRMQVLRLANGVTVINDAYNANPASTRPRSIRSRAAPGRSIAVLGEMRELGAESAALHRQVGAHAAARGVRWLLAVGPQAEDIAAGARAAARAAPPQWSVVCADAGERGRAADRSAGARRRGPRQGLARRRTTKRACAATVRAWPRWRRGWRPQGDGRDAVSRCSFRCTRRTRPSTSCATSPSAP